MFRVLKVSMLLTLAGAGVEASSCSAQNEVGDVCSIDCAAGQAAQCTNATGATSPTCSCSGDPSMVDAFGISLDERAQPLALQPSGNDVIRQTDILVSINARLSQLRDYKIGQACTDVVVGQQCRNMKSVCSPDGGGANAAIMSLRDPGATPQCIVPICIDIKEKRCSPVMGKLTATPDVRATGSISVDTESPNWNEVPISFYGLRATYVNCNPERQTMSFGHNKVMTVGERYTKTEAIKNGQSITVKVTGKYGDAFSAEAGATFSREVTITDQAEVNAQRQETFNYAETVNIPAMHRVVYTHEWVQKVARMPFSGTAVVDGSINDNLEGVAAISQVLGSSDDRAFAFSGVVEGTMVAQGLISNNAQPLTTEQCADPEVRPLVETYLRN